jgi:DnaJ homolog subfamily A member 2
MFNHYMQVTCSECQGSGKQIPAKDRCKKCKGTKLTEEKKTLEFWIEKGMRDGERIILKGEADQEPGKETGDVIFILDEQPHEVFERKGTNLFAKLKISLMEALCGFSRIVIKTLDGRGLKYTHRVEKGQVIRPGEVFKITGEGMPLGKKSEGKGDLFLKAEIEFPEDGWLTNPGEMDLLRSLLMPKNGKAEMNGLPEIVDEVNFEKVDDDEYYEEGWETESEGNSDGAAEQCTTQ